MADMKGQSCRRPGCNGHYDETDLYCDWDGVVKCVVCGHTVARHSEIPVKTTERADDSSAP